MRVYSMGQRALFKRADTVDQPCVARACTLGFNGAVVHHSCVCCRNRRRKSEIKTAQVCTQCERAKRAVYATETNLNGWRA